MVLCSSICLTLLRFYVIKQGLLVGTGTLCNSRRVSFSDAVLLEDFRQPASLDFATGSQAVACKQCRL